MGVLVVVALGSGLGRAEADTCKARRITMLVDRSTSTRADLEGDEGMKSKWEIMRGALLEIVEAHDDEVELGLTVFPETFFNCNAGGKKLVSPGLHAGHVISSFLGAPQWQPTGDSWSPIGQAFVELVHDPGVMDTVLFITDGRQSCPPIDPEGMWPVPRIVEAVSALRARGVVVHVVGFGNVMPTQPGDDMVDAYALNQMAIAGGVAAPGCDAGGTVFADENACYRFATSEAGLKAVLGEIVDEAGTPSCGECTGGPKPEVCDGVLDEDCDGDVDEDCACVNGQQRACGGPDVGVCRSGTQLCAQGAWGACEGAVGPAAESCDGMDNDCDSEVDEGCACQAGATRVCGGPDVGACRSGTQTCTSVGEWGACAGAVGPGVESCDGVDNDCDGVVDAECACTSGETRACGFPDEGRCRGGMQECVAGAWSACDGTIGPATEICDGLDNDCDGQADEQADNVCPRGFSCADGRCVKDDEAVVPMGTGGEGEGCAVGRGRGDAATWIIGLLVGLGWLSWRRGRCARSRSRAPRRG